MDLLKYVVPIAGNIRKAPKNRNKAIIQVQVEAEVQIQAVDPLRINRLVYGIPGLVEDNTISIATETKFTKRDSL